MGEPTGTDSFSRIEVKRVPRRGLGCLGRSGSDAALAPSISGPVRREASLALLALERCESLQHLSLPGFLH